MSDLAIGGSFTQVRELHPTPTVMQALRALAGRRNVLLLDSAAIRPERGRYSWLMADPVQTFERPAATAGMATAASDPVIGSDPFTDLRRAGSALGHARLPGLPPFQGGIAGLMSYELGGCWERIPPAAHDPFAVPLLSAGIYPWVIAWDHIESRAWIIAQGWAETGAAPSARLAEQRLNEVLALLSAPAAPEAAAAGEAGAGSPPPDGLVQVAEGVWSDFSRAAYLQTLQRVIDYIYAGDIFQANLTQRLFCRAPASLLDLYDRLRTVNPAPFAGYYATPDFTILSASPERFLHVAEGVVSTRPIKGTRRRSSQAEADLFTRDSLRDSEKDLAENVMIVDLLRNDLSRVCRPGSVTVPQLCDVETYATVQHLVSEVRGELVAGCDAWDLFAATFPGGSITGAPKVRAMEIIAELEPTARGPYTGSLFYVSPDGVVDSNLLIRTFVSRQGWLQCGVGGGIVAQSDPVAEYEETWHKAAGMLQALGLQAQL